MIFLREGKEIGKVLYYIINKSPLFRDSKKEKTRFNTL